MPTTTNMEMVLPTVGVTVDPTWASNLNDALTNKVDLHNHTTGLGVQVPTAGLNINADLSFQSNDATNLRSLSLNNNVATLPSGDVRAVYASGGNLYYNNNSGVAVQITDGASLDTGSLALNVWALQELAGNLTILAADSYVFINTSTAAARVITLPAASGVTAGRYFIIKDKTGSGNTNNITITPAGSDTIDGVASSTAITSAYGSTTLVSDGVSGWLTNAALGGFVQLGGDLLGTGTTTTAPRVSGLTGIAGLVTMANNTALNTRNLANDTNVNLAKMNASNVVQFADSAFATTISGASITASAVAGATLQAGTGNVTVGSTLGDVILTATDDLTATCGDDAVITGGDTLALSSTAGATTMTSGTTMTMTSGTNMTLTSTSGAISVSATAGGTSIHGNTGVTITANSSLNATIAADINLHSTSGDLDVEVDEARVNATTGIYLTATTSLNLAGQIYVPTKAVTSSPYTVDTTTKDYVIFVDSTSGARTINLPAASNGRVLIIQDVSGTANTNNITLVRSGSDTIQGVASDYVMDADFQGVTLVAYSGGSWFIIGT